MKSIALFSLAAAAAAWSASVPDLEKLQSMAARFAPVELRVDTSKLSAGDRAALRPLLEAAVVIDDLFLTQMWSGNHALLAKLRHDTTPLGRARLDYFLLNKGPWSSLDDHAAFLPDVPARKPEGANFYPAGMTRADFEAWLKTLDDQSRRDATGFFTVIHRRGGQLVSLPYSREYREPLERLAALLRDAAAKTDNATLRRFLTARAGAFLSNDYYASDVAWMDLDAPIDVTIGPYETYNDELFNYKAAFEAYINLRDDAETEKVKFFGAHMQEIENALPLEAKYRNPKLGAMAPIRVVNQILATGDAAHGVRTAAYNLPNDERVISEKGSKRVMLRNVQEAKFNATLLPISKRVLPAAAQRDLSFDAFFTHILAHEMTHGIGPHNIAVAGRATTPRKELRDLYSAIEEAKADVCGLFMLQHMYDNKLLEGGAEAERRMYTTFLASAFRTLRFGVHEAHGRGMALQFNYLLDKGAFRAHSDGTFSVDPAKIKAAVRDLTRDLLMLEATGDYAGAKRLLDSMAVMRPELQRALDALKDIPTDIKPVNVTAGGLLAGR